LEKTLELGESGVESGLAQFLARLLPLLRGKMPLKRDRLLGVERLEIAISRVLLEPMQRLGGRINGRLAVTPRSPLETRNTGA
jgi:hypothetical protein